MLIGVLPCVQLCDALAAKAVRVIDLFREWDDDGTGSVDRKEFRRGLAELGYEGDRTVVDELFNSMDPDGSGSLSLEELNAQLRRRIELDPSLQAGGAGEIETASTNTHALRKGKAAMTDGGTRLLQGLDLDESAGGKPVAEQVREWAQSKA